MNDKLIGNLALQFSTEEYDLDADAWRIGKKMLEWLLRRYCLVEKSKVETKYKESLAAFKSNNHEDIKWGLYRLSLLDHLFPEIAKEVKE